MAGQMEEELREKLQAFQGQVVNNAENVLFKVMPTKILELQAMIEKTANTDSPFHLSHSPAFTDASVYPAPPPSTSDEPQAKKRKRTDGENGVVTETSSTSSSARFQESVHANQHMVDLHAIVKKECEELASNIDVLKLWINLTMPKIEDGDNFGVQIQEECLSELHRSQESAYNLRDMARQDHVNRAKICSKILKYPHLEDYVLALKEHDSKQLFLARQHLIDIRNVYAVIADILHKNINKIRSPKANNSIGMY